MKENITGIHATSSLSKGMKRLLLMIFIMMFGLVVAWRGVNLSNGLLFCAEKNVSYVYGGFLPDSTGIEEKKKTKQATVKSRKRPVYGGDGLPLAGIEEKKPEQTTVQSSKRLVDGGDELILAGIEEKKKTKQETIQSSKQLVDGGDGLTLACDYTRGKWVKDKNRPIYSGKKCKAWLSGMWACRLMDRPNFDFENYRWQPDRCNLPKFDGLTFLSRMQNKVLAFVGDSIGRQQYQSMMCLITGGLDDLVVEDVSLDYGFYKPRGALRADGTAQRFKSTNTTVIYHWSSSLCEIEPLNRTNPKTEYALHLDRPAWFLQKYIDKLDVLVLNTGHHWNRGKFNANKWIMHVNGKPNKDRGLSDFKSAYNFAVHKVLAWLHEQLERNHTMGSIYMRSLSPRHFFNGEWDSGGSCDDNSLPVEQKNVTGRMTWDPVAESAVLGTRVRLLNVTYLSQFRDEAHISKYRSRQGGGQDCLHWCLPGVPDVWNEVLYADLFYGHGSKQKQSGGKSDAIL